MCSTNINSKIVLLTGLPRIGKTTLVHKTCDLLKNKGVNVVGFFTEEIVDKGNSRIGFDIVTLDGKRGRLARTEHILAQNDKTKFRVGNYIVFPKEFENLAVPILEQKGENVVFVIDEIGKMELFSSLFIKSVSNLFERPNVIILATIPVSRGKPLPLVECLRSKYEKNIITVKRDNRDKLLDEIVKCLIFS